MQLNRVVLCHAANFVKGTLSSCAVVIMASTKLSGEIFTVRHSSYPVSKFELGQPSEKIAGIAFCDKELKLEARPLNLVHISCTLQAYIHGGY